MKGYNPLASGRVALNYTTQEMVIGDYGRGVWVLPLQAQRFHYGCHRSGQADSCQIAILQNPWQPEKILHRYVLVNKNQPLPQNLPEGTVIRTPVNRAVVYSSVHYSLLELLQATNCVDGVCDAEYILNPELQEKIRKGTVRNYGNSMSPNIEQITVFHSV